MLKRLTTITLFLILTLFVTMVGVSEAQTIPPPDTFSTTPQRTSVAIIWDEPNLPWGWGVDYYNLRYRKQGDTSWTESSHNIPAKDGNHRRGKTRIPEAGGTALTPNTTYEYQARTKAYTVLWVTKTSDWSSTQTVTTKANQAPTTVGTIPDRSIVEASGFTMNPSSYFTDPESDTLTYTATSSDTSIAKAGKSSTVVNYIAVSAVAPGSATISVIATDVWGATATQSINLMVTANQAPQPVGTIPDQTLKVGGTDLLGPREVVTVNNIGVNFSDPEYHTLTYSATSSDTSIATVEVAESTFHIRLFTTAVGEGSATITVTATDSLGATGTQTFTATVLPNSAPEPVGSIPSQTVSLSGSAETVEVSSYFSDPDKNPLTYTATSSDTSKATVSVSEATVTISAVAAGSVTLTVTATDNSGATATQTISVTVVTNRTPVRVGSIPTQTVSTTGAAGTVDLSAYFSDPDGNTLTYSATSSNVSRATGSVSGSTLTITAVAAGWSTITVNAIDASNAAATQTFSVNVVSNRSPTRVGSIPDQSVRVGATAGTVDVSSYFSDPDGHALTYSATSSSTSRATVSMSGSTLTITAVAAGSATIRVKAIDPYNASRTQSFSVKVVASEAVVAVSSIPKQTLSLSGITTATVDVSPYFSGPSGVTLTYSATSSSTSKTTVSVSGSTATITGVAAGYSTIRVTATHNNASATQSFSVRVYSNRAPTPVGTIPTLEVPNSGYDQFGISGYFSDPDGNALTYTASISDNTIAEANVGTGANSSTLYVLANGLGTATITVTATDPSNATATQTFSVTVIPQTADVVPSLSSTEQLLLSRLLTYDTIIFNELHNGSDDANDWLELRNLSTIDIPISEWHLRILTGDRNTVIPFPVDAVIPAGEVLLITNTEMATSDASVAPVVIKSFALPQSEFALILRSPNVFGDITGNYYEGQKERPKTSPALTVNTVWDRMQPIVSGYRTEAWTKSTYRNGLGSPGYQPSKVTGDLNNDGVVNILDLVLVASKFRTNGHTVADLNGDNTVDIRDLVLVANALNNVSAAPTAKQSGATTVNHWLMLARQEASKVDKTAIPKGFSYERGIQILETLARALTPESTALLANYPNPFNPETWIPYQLSKAADVTVAIYASNGTMVRTLVLGHQDVGMYKTRSQAAYWDGTNEMGESVSSGIYFYTLTAGDFSATRKMLILK